MCKELLKKLCAETKAELENNILPFWMTVMVDRERGGFMAGLRVRMCWKRLLRRGLS